MSTLTHSQARQVDALHPAFAALAGAAAFALSMTAGEVFGLNSDGPGGPPVTVTELLAYAGLVLAGVALAVWLGTRARSGAPDRLARYALGLSLGSAATFIAFWSGWPHVLGAVAIALAIEHRRRIGGFTAPSAIAAALGSLSLVASIVVCITG